MIYPEKAFNDFDYIFCSGKHHIKEIKEINKLYGCSIKGLKSGYTKLDLLHKVSQTKFMTKHNKKVVLLAPSWGKENILESIGESLIDAIITKGYILIIRPHPVFFIENQDIIQRLKERCNNTDIFLEDPSSSDNSFFEADVMISDYSGVAFEYAFLREKPILFVDVTRKVLNDNYQNIQTSPIEIYLRNDLGMIVDTKVDHIVDSLELVIHNSKNYQKNIVTIRENLLFNYLNTSSAITSQIKHIIKEL